MLRGAEEWEGAHGEVPGGKNRGDSVSSSVITCLKMVSGCLGLSSLTKTKMALTKHPLRFSGGAVRISWDLAMRDLGVENHSLTVALG